MASFNWKGVTFLLHFYKLVLGTISFPQYIILFYLLLPFFVKVPSKEQVEALSKDLASRAAVPGLPIYLLALAVCKKSSLFIGSSKLFRHKCLEEIA